MDTFLSLFTAEHLPVLQSLDMSCFPAVRCSRLANGLQSLRFTAASVPSLEMLMLDSSCFLFSVSLSGNDLRSLVLEPGSFPRLHTLKLGCRNERSVRSRQQTHLLRGQREQSAAAAQAVSREYAIAALASLMDR